MRQLPIPRLLAGLLVIGLAATACQSSDGAEDGAPTTVVTESAAAQTTENDGGDTRDGNTSDGSTSDGDEPVGDDPSDADRAALDTMLVNLEQSYRAIDGVWDGYRPTDHPVVLAWKDQSGSLTGAVAINHPSPDELGTATAVEAPAEVGTVHWIANLESASAAILNRLDAFEFETTIGGVDSFLMIAGGPDGFFAPDATDYVSTLIHEMFHRYQFKAFSDEGVGQDVEGYAYTPENIELAALEDRALAAAIGADDDRARTEAARRVAAIRLARRVADGRVVLDDSQERFEGSARYLEHLLGDESDGYLFHQDNFDAELLVEPDPSGGIKDHYGFGRFYASGAAVFRLLDELGVDDVAARTEAGESPADILIDELEVGADDVENLLADARGEYDSLDQLAQWAAEASRSAENEPPVFGDDSFDASSSDAGGTSDGGEGVQLSDEEARCLEDNGVDMTGQGGIEISDDVFQECLA